MRWLFVFLSLVLLTAAAPVRDWSATTTRLPSGAMLIGNPAAPLKLVEYGSYTCSHCAAFAAESDKVLKHEMIATGSVSLEYRHLIRDRLDLAAAILARCAGTPRFASASSRSIQREPSRWYGGMARLQADFVRPSSPVQAPTMRTFRRSIADQPHDPHTTKECVAPPMSSIPCDAMR